MTDLDKMARELLAAEHEADDPASMTAERLRSGLPVMWWADPALRAIRAAQLSAPPGYVLVPVVPTEAMQLAATDELVGGCCSMCSRWECSMCDARRVYAGMIAAAPEVKPNE